MKNCLSFDDILLVPKYSEVLSRKEIDLKSNLSKSLTLGVPVVSSPMDTVTESAMAIAMSNLGGLGIIHRYNTLLKQSSLVKTAVKSGAKNVGAAVGVSGDYVDRARAVVGAGAKILCVDIAHGHHILMKEALKILKNEFGDSVHIMAGNVATRVAYEELASWGADSVRVGIGGGSICSTRIQTGHGVPTLQSIIDCSFSEYAGDVPIIADGGIKNSGDMVKALAAGADFVMVGSLLAGTSESPGEIFEQNGQTYKVYRGMASKDAQINWRGHYSSIEGVSSYVPLKGCVSDVLEEMKAGIKSGLSYSGVRTIRELQNKSDFITQTVSGISESGTHINNRNK
jgi:IMP dehydrogenase